MRRTRLVCVLAVVTGVGCARGPELVPVTGVVKIDGKPAEGVQITFWPGDGARTDSRDRYAAGMTGKDGRFELRSFSEKGIESGEYKVTFSRLVADGKVVADVKKPKGATRETLLDKYTSQDTTDVTARVTGEKHDFVFEISSKPR